MSKRSRKKAARRRQRRQNGLVLLCSKCLAAQEMTPAALMERLAGSLNALEQAGMRVRVRTGHVIAEGTRGGGYVIPPLHDHGGGWETHMMTYNPLACMSRREDNPDCWEE